MRVARVVDRDLLTQAIAKAEQNGPLANLSALYAKVAEIYNDSADETITPAIVKCRIEEWKLHVQTQKGKRGRQPGQTITRRQPNQTNHHLPNKQNDVHNPPKPKIRTLPQNVHPHHKVCGCHCIPITAPAQDCPVKLTNTDLETVGIWAQKVIEAGHQKGVHYTPDALKYFVRHFYEYNSPEWVAACNSLREFCDSQPSLPADPAAAIDTDDDRDEDVELNFEVAPIDLSTIEEEDVELNFEVAPIDLSTIEEEPLE